MNMPKRAAAVTIAVTFVALILVVAKTAQGAPGKDGQPGAVGRGGSDGKRGDLTTNVTPYNANAEYEFYLPILNGSLQDFAKVLKAGARVNGPIGGVIGRPTAFQLVIQYGWLEALQLMLGNPDVSNRPDLRQIVQTQQGARVSIYVYLTVSRSLDSAGQLKSSDVAVVSSYLPLLSEILDAEDNLEALVEETIAIRETLTAPSNKYATFPPNIQARQLIEERIRKLRLRQAIMNEKVAYE